MKQQIFILLLAVLAVKAGAQNNAIFRGGSADGWTSQAFAQSGNTLFRGGTGDGSATGSFAQAANAIFKGGTGDGWDRSSFAQGANAIFTGGDGDGWDRKAFAQAGNAIFAGGTGDGWDSDSFLQAGNGIFGGGQGDGWASNYRVLGALPVNLAFFKAEKGQNVSYLTWETSAEQGTAFFDVQRSADAVNFETIGTVAAAGNSSRPLSYAFTDRQPLSGYNYYRLKQVDKDQRFQYSPVRSVLFDAVRVLTLRAYPVPVTASLTVELPAGLREKDVFVNIVSSGGVVLQQVRAARNRLSDQKRLDLSRLPAGAYSLQVVAEGYNASLLFVKQ